MAKPALTKQFKQLVKNQIISFNEYLKSLLIIVESEQVKKRVNEVFDQLQITAHTIEKSQDLLKIITLYQTTMNEVYITINNLLKVAVDLNNMENKTITLYELDEIFNASVLDVNAINNVINEPPNHSVIMRNVYDLKAVFERYKQGEHLKEFRRLLKVGDFDDIIDYLENNFTDLNIEDLFTDTNVVYQITSIIESIVTYWSTYCSLRLAAETN